MCPRRLLIVGLAGVMAVLLSACAGGGATTADDADTGSSTASESTEEAAADDGHGDGGHATAEEAPAPVDGASTVEVSAIDIDFEPATMSLVAGEPTNVNVTNEGQILHDFTLTEAGVHLNLEPGDAQSAAVVIDEPGSYQAICTVPGHADGGMVIDVTVE